MNYLEEPDDEDAETEQTIREKMAEFEFEHMDFLDEEEYLMYLTGMDERNSHK